MAICIQHNNAARIIEYDAMTQQTTEPVEPLVEESSESAGLEEGHDEGARLTCAFLGLDENEDENKDGESGSDDGSSNQQPWQRKVLYLGFIGVLCVTSAGILISEIDASGRKEGPNPRHGVFDAPQFEQLLWEQIQPVLGSSVAQMELSGHIKHSIRHLKAIAEKDLPEDQASALKNAQLTAQNWIDLQDMMHGARNSNVQEAGKITLNVLNDNLFSSEEVIAQRLKEALQPQAYKLMELRSKIVPKRIDTALAAWAKRQNESHAAWKGLLDSPLALQPIRNSHASVDRRLSLGTGGKAVGILSVILVAIGEILIHVDMFVPKFALPSWAWKLILTPVEVVSALACSNGANAYCNTIMGAMGLNTLDAVFVLFCQKKLFGQNAADYCTDLNAVSGAQKSEANAVSGALAGGKIFKR